VLDEARPRCYVASPLGFTEAGRDYYTRIYLPALAEIVTPVDPWSLTDPEAIANAQADGGERDIALKIGRRNTKAIRSCRLLVAYLDGAEIDSGTAAELGFGAAVGLRCFGLRTDLRQSGEAGMRINLQVESFVIDSGGVICDSLKALITELRRATEVLGRSVPLRY
jgi:nucleoside 2-deoxyribosyltransferase